MNFSRKVIIISFTTATVALLFLFVNTVNKQASDSSMTFSDASSLIVPEQNISTSNDSASTETEKNTSISEKQATINLQQLLDGVDKSLEPFDPSDMSNQNIRKRTLHNKFIEMEKIYTPYSL